jgi:membrane protein implicated in regulation of membrane protease activity
MSRDALLIGIACVVVGAGVWAVSGNLAVGGLLFLLGAVLVVIGLAPSEYDEEEQLDTEEEILNVYDEE